MLQIGIRAWKQHLACLGSRTSHIKIVLERSLGVTPYLTSFIRIISKPPLKKGMKLSTVDRCFGNMLWKLLMFPNKEVDFIVKSCVIVQTYDWVTKAKMSML